MMQLEIMGSSDARSACAVGANIAACVDISVAYPWGHAVG